MSMLYHKILELSIIHESFPEGDIDAFSLTPFVSTADIFSANHIVIKKIKNVFLFFVGVEEGEQFDAMTFFQNVPHAQFKLGVDDAAFFNYTDMGTDSSPEVLFFENETDSLILSPSQPYEIDGFLLSQPLAIITLDFKKLFWNSGEEGKLQLHFSARKVFVEYFLNLEFEPGIDLLSIKMEGLHAEFFKEIKREQTEVEITYVAEKNFGFVKWGRYPLIEIYSVFVSNQAIPAVFSHPSTRRIAYVTNRSGRPLKETIVIPFPNFFEAVSYQKEDGSYEYRVSVVGLHTYRSDDAKKNDTAGRKVISSKTVL